MARREYLILGGREAWIRMQWAQNEHDSRVVKHNDVDATQLLANERDALLELERQRLEIEGIWKADDPIEIKLPGLPVLEMAKLVGPLMINDDGSPSDVVAAYDVMFRPHSAWDVHAGTKALEAFVVTDTAAGTASLQPVKPWIDPVQSVALTTMYVGLLGTHVFDNFEIPSAPLSEALKDLVRSLQPGPGD